MKKILPVTDFQRQAGQILSDIAATNEAVIITQRGRPAAVLLSAAHYSQLEEDMERLDELELIEMVRRSRESLRAEPFLISRSRRASKSVIRPSLRGAQGESGYAMDQRSFRST